MEVVRATGNGAMNESVTPLIPKPTRILEVRLHLSAAPTASDTFTIAIDSGAGTAYDVVLDTQDMVGLTDYVWRPVQPAPIDKNDSLLLTFSNADAATWGVEVWFER